MNDYKFALKRDAYYMTTPLYSTQLDDVEMTDHILYPYKWFVRDDRYEVFDRWHFYRPVVLGVEPAAEHLFTLSKRCSTGAAMRRYLWQYVRERLGYPSDWVPSWLYSSRAGRPKSDPGAQAMSIGGEEDCTPFLFALENFSPRIARSTVKWSEWSSFENTRTVMRRLRSSSAGTVSPGDMPWADGRAVVALGEAGKALAKWAGVKHVYYRPFTAKLYEGGCFEAKVYPVPHCSGLTRTYNKQEHRDALGRTLVEALMDGMVRTRFHERTGDEINKDSVKVAMEAQHYVKLDDLTWVEQIVARESYAEEIARLLPKPQAP